MKPDDPKSKLDISQAGSEDVSVLAERAFSRTTGADAIRGNAVRLLIDAAENYPAWLEAIRSAQRTIFFEMYIVDDDATGRQFAEALEERARAGVRVKILCDWLGSLRGRSVWKGIAASGAQMRMFNPPRLTSPLAWLSRDHRKTLTIDGRIGFVSGLCISCSWEGNSKKRLEPWRDTGIAIEGPAVAALEMAFAQVWDAAGVPLDPALLRDPATMQKAGNVMLRVVAGAPSTASTYRLDLTIASVARRYLWLTDAYFVGTAPYVQALAAAARDGVDVRLLVPGASDIPLISPVSRANYRSLLQDGVRVFEWNGTMLHAKTAVADDVWARVGSTNLNFASWLSNYELDVAIEDEAFAHQVADQYERDLERSTEIVLGRRSRIGPADARAGRRPYRRARAGSAGRAAAGAVSMGSALGAALTNRRQLGPAEAGLLFKMGLVVIAIAVVAALWPAVVAWPIALFAGWFGLAWLAKAAELRHKRGTSGPVAPRTAVTAEGGDPPR